MFASDRTERLKATWPAPAGRGIGARDPGADHDIPAVGQPGQPGQPGKPLALHGRMEIAHEEDVDVPLSGSVVSVRRLESLNRARFRHDAAP